MENMGTTLWHQIYHKSSWCLGTVVHSSIVLWYINFCVKKINQFDILVALWQVIAENLAYDISGSPGICVYLYSFTILTWKPCFRWCRSKLCNLIDINCKSYLSNQFFVSFQNLILWENIKIPYRVLVDKKVKMLS